MNVISAKSEIEGVFMYAMPSHALNMFKTPRLLSHPWFNMYLQYFIWFSMPIQFQLFLIYFEFLQLAILQLIRGNTIRFQIKAIMLPLIRQGLILFDIFTVCVITGIWRPWNGYIVKRCNFVHFDTPLSILKRLVDRWILARQTYIHLAHYGVLTLAHTFESSKAMCQKLLFN